MAEQKPADKLGTALEARGAAPVALVPAVRAAPSEPAEGRRLWIWGAVGFLALGLVGIGYYQFLMPHPTLAAVEISALAPVTRVLAVNGRIAAVHSVDVRSVVTGSLAALSVSEGDVVKADQVLAQVDPAAQNAIVRQAVAGLDAALVTQQQATEAYDRAASLGVNVARTVLETDAHAVQSAAQDVARQTAVLDQATVVLNNHTLRAPVAGSIVTLDADVGQIVGPTIPLLTLANLGDLVVEADVDETYATQIALNQPAVLQLTGDAQTRAGHVSFVSPRVDVATGGLAVKIAFDVAVTAPIGLTVATNIIVEKRDRALTVPRTALQSGAAGTGVFVVTDGAAQFRPLTVVEWPAARLIVTAGLVEGDVVITDTTGVEGGQSVVTEQP